jgi:hypothetical protein
MLGFGSSLAAAKQIKCALPLRIDLSRIARVVSTAHEWIVFATKRGRSNIPR